MGLYLLDFAYFPILYQNRTFHNLELIQILSLPQKNGSEQIVVGSHSFKTEDLFIGHEKTKSMVLKVIIHESIHLVLRYFYNNYLEITPICSNTALPCYEGGFRFETYLFGAYDLDILKKPYADDILDQNIWDSPIPLFVKDKNQDYPKRKVINILCSGLFLMNEDELTLCEM